jgi:hypothetical protein
MKKVSPDELKDALLQLAAEWIERCNGEIKDVADYQRITKCVIDLTRTDDDAAAQTVRVIMTPPADQYAG